MLAVAARPRWLIIFAAFALSAACLLVLWPHVKGDGGSQGYTLSNGFRPAANYTLRASSNVTRPAANVVCKGPDGHDLVTLKPKHDFLNTTYPTPTLGSYEALGLEQSWMTIDERYGPYGYGEGRADYAYAKLDWTGVDWGQLQTDCFEANRDAYGDGGPDHATSRFQNVTDADPPTPPLVKTGRQAIVLRTWSTYIYHPEDFWNIRSLIAEAALATGGEYRVFLLVDLKCEDCQSIHHNATLYEEVLRASVPPEFLNIALLLHPDVQQTWYEKVDTFHPVFQIMQPLQLFAHFYPEYDHYWQFEMDTRFLGHAGKMLQAFDNFGNQQPTKQSAERASWSYMSSIHGSFEHFTAMVDKGLQGGAGIWGPIPVDLISPVGPEPPVPNPRNDTFTWGVGRDADVLFFGPLNDVLRFGDQDDWVFKGWHRGGLAPDVPRYMAVPAQARASFDLLQTIHLAQRDQGLAVPSEATLPTFALWHGLKLVGLPLPKFQFPERDVWELNHVHNGGVPEGMADGMANGPGSYRSASLAFFGRPLSFDWWSSLPNAVFDRWMGKPYGAPLEERRDHGHIEFVQVPNEMPPFLREVGGKVYAPNLLLHPRKSNANV